MLNTGNRSSIVNGTILSTCTLLKSEMREQGRHGRELQEHFCFLVLSNSAVMEIYRYGMSTDGNAMKALGNPLMGVYLHRHVDVALKFAHQKSMNTGKVMIFKMFSPTWMPHLSHRWTCHRHSSPLLSSCVYASLSSVLVTVVCRKGSIPVRSLQQLC
ncbi:testis-expressed protein 15 [Rhinatrema bivittatum]|uniref:testis-expressed protein 15 n=1 Tax=Rhinatrema bivittatum TaxID=194408 RepID=UPI001125D52A|nr:testis-expressed protein 15 [Rhinatrema bivittatum]